MLILGTRELFSQPLQQEWDYFLRYWEDQTWKSKQLTCSVSQIFLYLHLLSVWHKLRFPERVRILYCERYQEKLWGYLANSYLLQTYYPLPWTRWFTERKQGEGREPNSFLQNIRIHRLSDRIFAGISPSLWKRLGPFILTFLTISQLALTLSLATSLQFLACYINNLYL